VSSGVDYSIRRDQTSFRKDARKIEWDVKFGLVKVNPIATGTAKQVWRYLYAHEVPYNSLHDQNYSEHRLHALHARNQFREKIQSGALARHC